MKSNNFPTVSLRLSNLVVTSVMILLSILLAANTIRIRNFNRKSIELSELHIKYTDISMQLTHGSDVLTEQVRLFAETGDKKYMDGYFKEAKVSRSRDNAIDELSNLPWVHTEDKIRMAMEESVRLMEREYYSMKLTSIGYGIPENFLPEEVNDIVLDPQDAELSQEESKNKARSILFDDIYLESKRKIKANVNDFSNDMIEASRQEYINLKIQLETSSMLQNIIIISGLFIIFLTKLFISRFIVKPLVQASGDIKNNSPINMPVFIEEMNTLGDSYNNLLIRNIELIEKFGTMARKDALTGIGSRFAYNSYADKLSDTEKQVLLFMFDVNGLRDTNNSIGHFKGDELLINSAKCIKSIFGIYDYENCFRVGGDEFVAFIENEPRKQAHAYIDRFKAEAEKRNVSVSVGYAYAENASAASIADMFRDADENMYEDKKRMKG